MSLFGDSTNAINGQIAALKTISEKSFLKYRKITSGANTLMDALMDIFTQLGGYDDMIKAIENILSNRLDDIEEIIKSAIKLTLKQIISCGVEPSIGDQLILSGVTFDIKRIDPMTILSIDPLTESGSFAYFDNLKGINSKDFNVFLYTIIKRSIEIPTYGGDSWYKVTYSGTNKIKTELLHASFKEYDVDTKTSNQLTIKIPESFRGKKISFFISEYLDSIKLFNNVQIISSIFDNVLSSKIISLNKTTDQLAVENLVQNICDKIINNVDEGDVIDDSFYQFSNDIYNQMLEESENKKKGVFIHNQGNEISVDQELLIQSLTDLKTDGLLISQQTKILSDTIDNITNDLVAKSKIDNNTKFSFKFDFIRKLITKLTTTLTMFIFSPKIIYLFSMTSKMLGLTDESDIIEFIKKNINIIKLIVIKIRDVITEELIKKIKEMLAPLLAKAATELLKEKFAIYKKQLDAIKLAISSVF